MSNQFSNKNQIPFEQPFKGLKLSASQMDLAKELKKLDQRTEKSQGLDRIYLGALRVLLDDENPDRLALAAHELRELMDKLPFVLDVSVKRNDGELDKQMREIRQAWEKFYENWMKASKKGEPIGTFCEEMIQKALKFFSWHSLRPDSRKDEASQAFRNLDGSGMDFPLSLEQRNIEEWSEIRKCFVSLAHHGERKMTVDEFKNQLSRFEKFIMDRLFPRTFTDFDEIDKLVEEVEKND